MKSWHRPLTLRLRLILIIFLAAIPAVGLLIYSSINEYENRWQHASDNLLSLSELAATSQSKILHGIHNLLIAISKIPVVYKFESSACDAYLASLLPGYVQYQFESFSVYNSAGIRECGALPFASGRISIQDRPYFQTALAERRFVVSGFLISKLTGSSTIAFVLPIIRDEQVTGIVTSTATLETLTSMASEIKLPVGADFSIIDQQGIVLVRQPYNPDILGKPISRDIIAKSLNGAIPRLIESTGDDGVERLYSIAPVLYEGHPIFHVIIGLDKDRLISEAKKSLVFNLTAVLSIIGLVFLGTWLLSKKLVITPASQLIRAAQQVGGGNLKTRTNIDYGTGEIGQLARQFDEMTTALEQREQEFEAAYQRAEYLALHDELTRLPNRRALGKKLSGYLDEAKNTGTQVAVLFFDLDRFRVINDSLGHFFGDQLLIAAAERLVKCLRQNDVVARFGGDEYVAVLPGLKTSTEASRLAKVAVTCLSEPYVIQTERINTSASVGISIYPTDSTDSATLIKYAEVAMRRVKESHSKYQFFSKEMNTEAVQRLALENELRRALEQGELALFYQPQVRLKDNRVSGAEALIRWHHPTKGIIGPAAFIQLSTLSKVF
ncbi:diguanylate cyclase domain-containing protein [Noviherbaspirillum sedimenti]|uniref:Diguanylate cyclase n=1 Tax=Noviherbaspirillum sedimenti TaxID=2320865 RepID=A0A3A3FX20_9BURK|nr:diguanylate cyclase [Noviherbaspirillum sedimenti]RJG00171.1 diguanylate cyclase [Noviherbaspirillum sedimenti]